MTIKLNSTVARLLSVVIFFSGVFSANLQAQMISAPQVQQQYDKTQLLNAFEQENAQKILLSMGVDQDQVKERISNLTSEEITQLNNQIDELPAGSGVLGFIATIFIVLVITDMIGATDVFSFVHKVD